MNHSRVGRRKMIQEIVWRGLEPLEARLLMSLAPTAFEQEMLELTNRMRADPVGELSRLVNSNDANVNKSIDNFNVDMDALEEQWALLIAVPPLAFNEDLYDAAFGHTQQMIDFDEQSHQLPGEPTLRERVTNQGYPNTGFVGESVFTRMKSPFHGHAAFAIDWGGGAFDTDGDGIQDTQGHRDSIMGRDAQTGQVYGFREVGIAIIPESNTSTDVGPLVITLDFGNRTNLVNPYLLGVVYDDLNGNGFYNAGEGLSGVTVQVVATGDTTGTFEPFLNWESGGYQLQLPAGTYDVTFSGGDLPLAVTKPVTIGADNVKADVNLDTLPSLQFSMDSFTESEAMATATITVTRTGDPSVAVRVTADTSDGSAMQGVDYTDIGVVVELGVGELSKTFEVPILNDTDIDGDETVNLALSNAVGALLGARDTAVLNIIDNDDVVGPRIAGLSFTPKGSKIGSIVLGFDEPLAAATAQDLANYGLFNAGKDKLHNTLDDGAMRIKSATYDAGAGTVTLKLRKPAKQGKAYRITAADGITDTHANLLDGEFDATFLTGNGTPGGDFTATAGLGKKFAYRDADGDAVALKLKGGGRMFALLHPDGHARRIDLLDVLAGVSNLTGTVKIPKLGTGDGMTTIDLLNLNGAINSLLNPPFTFPV